MSRPGDCRWADIPGKTVRLIADFLPDGWKWSALDLPLKEQLFSGGGNTEEHAQHEAERWARHAGLLQAGATLAWQENHCETK